MMVEKQKETGGPAFPLDDGVHRGMTLRQYAAIKLRVPHSGVDWLDEMIVQSIRNDFAAKAMHSAMSNPILNDSSKDEIAVGSYRIADAMLKAREQ